LSAYADEETRQRAQAAEPCGFLSKLSDDRDLHMAIETMLAKCRA
jgi:DNA-binding NarL/FixJ family response regulator